MLRFLKGKLFILTLATIALIAIIIVSANKSSGLNWVNNIVSVPLTPVQKFLSSIGRKVEDSLSYLRDIEEVKLENDALKAEIAILRQQNQEMSVFEARNRELKQALSLKDQFEDFTFIGANIIAIDPGNWYNIFKIDKGSGDEIIEDCPVITSARGLIGRTLPPDISSAKVLTIINEESAISAWVTRIGCHAVVRGDIILKDKGLCRMDYIPLEADLEAGDLVETSGLGGIYPKGIIIGHVVEVRKTNSELDRYAIIQPAADFRRLEEVYILKSKTKQEIYSAGK